MITYEPSSHSGSRKLPPPLTAGIQDFFGRAAATTMNLLGTVALAPTPAADNNVWLLFPPRKKEEDPNPFRTAPEVVAISLRLVGEERK